MRGITDPGQAVSDDRKLLFHRFRVEMSHPAETGGLSNVLRLKDMHRKVVGGRQ